MRKRIYVSLLVPTSKCEKKRGAREKKVEKDVALMRTKVGLKQRQRVYRGPLAAGV